METLRALIRGDLSPAGNPISIHSSAIEDKIFAEEYDHHWLDSGTSALALALMDCRKRFASIVNPQVIIPGYCCPDLVAAALYAGVEPFVVDIAVDDAGYNLQQLEQAINQNLNVIAIIAVNFLGVKENLFEVRQLLINKTIKLIEDNAQWFPEKSKDKLFSSDYVTFSFGRGKPVSLLGGGLLLSKDTLIISSVQPEAASSHLSVLKLYAYNLLLHPHAYCFLNRNPFLKLGETHLHLLDKLEAMSAASRELLNDNICLYYQRDQSAVKYYLECFSDIQRLQGMFGERRGRLLRYPLLVDNQKQRDTIVKELNTHGLGASLLYQQELNLIEGVNEKIALLSPLVNANSFAKRLLTLPVHTYVEQKHLNKIKNIVLANV